MNQLYKPDGTPVTVNDNSLEYAISLGWTDEKPKPEKPKLDKSKAPKKAK